MRRLRWRCPLLVLAGTLVLFGCTEPEDGAGRVEAEPTTDATAGPQTEHQHGPPSDPPPDPRLDDTVVEGLTSPWGLAFLPDGSALVSERDTALVKRVDATGAVRTVGEVPGVDFSSAEGGLLGIAVPPAGSTGAGGGLSVYAYFSTAEDNRVVRMPYESGRLGAPEVVLDGIPVSEVHNGGRLAFGPDGMLYVTTGDATEGGNAPNPDSLAGKILRITPDGDPAPDNPTAGSPVLSLGHRNVQGIAWDDLDNLWASEFGQDTWDELNLIEPGNSYGWPRYEGSANAPGYEDPEVQWRPDAASPSGIAYADGAIWVAALGGERLWRVQLERGEVIGQPTAFFTGELGRLRTVEVAPDGALWLTTSNTDGRGDPRPGDDRIVRVTLG